MKTYQQLFEIFTSHINAANYGTNPKELYEPINYMMQLGGKRLRPILALMACDLFDSNIEKALPAAHAIEVFHNFTLVHDDIMDNAPLRRGKETVYKKWNMPIAILSGDLMMIKATQLLCETETQHLKSLLEIFNKTAVEVCEGQQIDMNFETQKSVSHDEYIEMIKLKTAVLLGCSLQLGALIGGAGHEDAQHLYEFGKNIGIAFQIQDDILDCYGDTKDVGKQLGGDILQNKKTILFIKALEQSKNNNDKTLEEIINSKNTDNKVEKVLSIYNKYNIYNYSIERRNSFIQIAKENLEKLSISNEKKEILESLIQHLVIRNS